MKVVVDASVALKWVVDEPGAAAAEALLDEELLAPSLWLVEAANALWRRVQREELTRLEADERLGELLRAPVTTTPVEMDATSALELANELQHPVYDCLYLAVAVRKDATFVTADRRCYAAFVRDARFSEMIRLVGGKGP